MHSGACVVSLCVYMRMCNCICMYVLLVVGLATHHLLVLWLMSNGSNDGAPNHVVVSRQGKGFPDIGFASQHQGI